MERGETGELRRKGKGRTAGREGVGDAYHKSERRGKGRKTGWRGETKETLSEKLER